MKDVSCMYLQLILIEKKMLRAYIISSFLSCNIIKMRLTGYYEHVDGVELL